MKADVTIEYCTVWNYEPRAVSLAATIRATAGIDSIELIPSDAGAFEIRHHGELLHSKLQTHEWPDFQALAEQIKARR